MDEHELKSLLRQLCAAGETEVVEFKEAKKSYDFGGLGKYFSALSNEANLQRQSCAWLIFGVKDEKKTIIGTQYRSNRIDLNSLKGEIADKTTNRITFIDIHELLLPEGRVLLFQIPAAPASIPVAWEGHYYGRDGEALVPLNLEEIERIRRQGAFYDWSAEICADAALVDLDPLAVDKAKEQYRQKNPRLAHQINDWDTTTFLNKARVTVGGKITRAAILLLGKPESAYFINPAVAQITWLLNDAAGSRKDYAHFPCPFLLAVDEVYQRIRNPRYRYIKQEETLFPDEEDTYDPFTIREAINNAIAHQDYRLGGRINVVESEDSFLLFSNLGSFLPGSVEKVVLQDTPQEYYRNPFLVQAMVNLNMIDTIGSGIRRMFEEQRKRFFPLPEYVITKDRLQLNITGRVLDTEFGRVLAQNPGLSLLEIMMLDKLQKGKALKNEESKHLKNRGLIEGRKPNYLFSRQVARVDDQLKAQYIRQKGFDDQHYRDMVLQYLRQFRTANRKQINALLLDKLPDTLNVAQKANKVNNLLSTLRLQSKIFNDGSNARPQWKLKLTD